MRNQDFLANAGKYLVRIKDRTHTIGTGFFYENCRTVLTAKHVVDSVPTERLSIEWNHTDTEGRKESRTYSVIQKKTGGAEAADFAVLTPGGTGQADCPFLSGPLKKEWKNGEQLMLAGFPRNHDNTDREGTAAFYGEARNMINGMIQVFVGGIETGEEERLKGLSGGPVVNRDTGEIRGLISSLTGKNVNVVPVKKFSLPAINNVLVFGTAVIVAAVITAVLFISTARVNIFGETGKITGLKSGQKVARCFSAGVELKNAPRKSHAWLILETGGLMWPKKPAVDGNAGSRQITICEQALANKGVFSVLLVSVTEEGNNFINRWFEIGDITHQYPGMAGIPGSNTLDRADGLIILDSAR